MSLNPLLATKFHMPSLRAGYIPRGRLTVNIAARPLSLIAAPAGSGKTTLAASLVNRKLLTGWLSLDEDDNDPVRFLHYVIAALQHTAPSIGETATALLQSPQPAQPTAVIAALINDLASLTAPIVLVLDDYHVIHTQPIHDALTYLLDHIPSTLRLVLLTRTDPPLPLARLRARNQLSEIRSADLRFTQDETSNFLNAMAVNLAAPDVALLTQQTEGWAVGLQLAALSLQGPSASASLTGSHPFIADYLLEEVFSQQPVPVQNFLLQTSILNRMCAPLCDAITKPPLAAHDMLLYLEKANLFLIPLDHERKWYRYHHLFAEFLRERLKRQDTDFVQSLHQRASLWHEQHNLMLEAIDHAHAVTDYDRAARLTHAAVEGWLRQGEIATLLNKLNALPQALILASADLCLWMGWALTLSGQLEDVEHWLAIAERHFLAEKQRAEHDDVNREGLLWNYNVGYGQAAAIRASLALQQGNHAAAIPLTQRALDLLPRNDPVLISAMELNLGQAHLALGDAASAISPLEQAATGSKAANHAYIYANALIALAQAHHQLGHPAQTRSFYQKLITFAQSRHLVHFVQQAEQAVLKLTDSTAPTTALNTRELEILRLLASGHSNKDIAAQLVLGVSTVRWHIKHLYHKLGVHNRTQAVHQARELGLL